MTTKKAHVVSICLAMLACGFEARGQQSSVSQSARYPTSGWSDASASSRVGQLQSRPSPKEMVVTAAYQAKFQAQGSLGDLPDLPTQPPSVGASSLDAIPSGITMPAAPKVLPGGGMEGMNVSPPFSGAGRLSDVSLPDAEFRAPSQPTNTLSDTPLPTGNPAVQSGTSMPMLGGSQQRPSTDVNQLVSQTDLGSSELRVRQQRSDILPPQTPGTAAQQPANQPRIPAQAVTTGQPYVSPSRPRGRYPTRPINPAFYQLAAFQRNASGSNVAIGTYPAGAQTPVQPPRQNHPASQPGVGQPTVGQSQQRASTPARFTSNATPMSATSIGLTQQQAQQHPGFYQTAFTQQCNEPGFPSTGINGAYVPPTLTPGNLPGMYTPNNAGYSPLFTLGQENYNVSLGRGIIGQPTVYVAGQPVRNFLRYLSP